MRDYEHPYDRYGRVHGRKDDEPWYLTALWWTIILLDIAFVFALAVATGPGR